jgi:GNAT superfamily N-acetyltransferase
MKIRRFKPEDAEGVVDIIHRDLIEVNSADYTSDVILSMVDEFTPDALKDLAKRRDVFVAEDDSKVTGIVSLDDNTVFTLFIDPLVHGQGIGSELMDYVENLAKGRGHESIELPASLTAHGFYLRRGYADVRETSSKEHGTNIIMRKDLT